MKYGHGFELHLHSKASVDSLSSLTKIARRAKKIGLSGFAITDHNQVHKPADLARLGMKFGLTIIPAVEVNTLQGDLIGLFMTEMPPRENINDTAKFILEKGGITLLPHPGRSCKIEQIDWQLINLVEIFNARSTPGENDFAQKYFGDMEIPKTCGSDAHLLGEIGNAAVMMPSADPVDVKAALKTGDFALGKMNYNKVEGIYLSNIICVYRKYSFVTATQKLFTGIFKKILRGK